MRAAKEEEGGGLSFWERVCWFARGDWEEVGEKGWVHQVP